ncbi:MAG: DoxX family protein [Gemmataceae bacterium]|nr:DoxX family protein [Gemmataceae bacterium]MDW8266713.1 DoxX family protein [Gemmataceae bacterium]
MFESFFQSKLGPLVLRGALGLFCTYHGFLKITYQGGMAWAAELAVPWQLMIAWGGFAAGLMLLVGLRCRLAAAIALGVTLGLVLWRHGWGTWRLPVTSLEPTVLISLVSLAVACIGAGEWSLDARGGAAGGRAPRKGRLAA